MVRSKISEVLLLQFIHFFQSKHKLYICSFIQSCATLIDLVEHNSNFPTTACIERFLCIHLDANQWNIIFIDVQCSFIFRDLLLTKCIYIEDVTLFLTEPTLYILYK